MRKNSLENVTSAYKITLYLLVFFNSGLILEENETFANDHFHCKIHPREGYIYSRPVHLMPKIHILKQNNRFKTNHSLLTQYQPQIKRESEIRLK